MNARDGISRRDVLRLAFAAGLSTAAARPLAAVAALSPTPAATAGPFYPEMKPLDRDADLTVVSGRRGTAQGRIVHLTGRVLDRNGDPIRDARVEIWQANTFGRYAHPADPNPAPLDPDFQGYGVQVTDREGRFRFKTIKPGPYPAGRQTRTPHVHFDITGARTRKVTQMLFAGEPLNDQDFVFLGVPRGREALLAQTLPPTRELEPDSILVRWDVVLG